MKTFKLSAWTLVLVLCLFSCKKELQKNTKPQSSVQLPPPPGQNPDSLPETYPAIMTPVMVSISATVRGYYEGLPALYPYTTKKYPLLVYLPGLDAFGEGREDLGRVVTWGIPKLLKDKKFPVSFSSGGKNYSFIIITPQFKYKPSAKEIDNLINYIVRRYRIDTSRIYVVGHSSGGGAVLDYSVDYSARVAAVVPISASYTSINDARAAMIVKNNLPLWAFHNLNDGTIPVDITHHFTGLINKQNPKIPARKTIFPDSGHDAWTKATDPAYTENGLSIYTWMLQYTR